MRNLELKARCADLRAARARVEAIGARFAWTRRQVDTYFTAASGRLKLREEADCDGRPIDAELISYRRPDGAGARVSEYEIVPIETRGAVRRLLGGAHAIVARVAKTRTLLLLGASRIHVDVVDGLGDFAEIERVLAESELEAGARGEVDRVAAALGIAPGDLVSESYGDLVRPLTDTRAGAPAVWIPPRTPPRDGSTPRV